MVVGYQEMLPMVQLLSNIYEQACPEQFQAQKHVAGLIAPRQPANHPGDLHPVSGREYAGGAGYDVRRSSGHYTQNGASIAPNAGIMRGRNLWGKAKLLILVAEGRIELPTLGL
jgi:hypothetical protein